MRLIVPRLLGATLAATALVSGAGIASAQTPPAEDLSAWNKVCYTDPQGVQTCSVLYQIVADTGQMVAQASINQRVGVAQMVFQVWIISSPGIFVGQGLRLQIDTNQPQVIEFLVCNAQYCVAEAPIDDGFVTALKRGGQMVLSAFIPQNAAPPNNRRQIDLPVTLRGFTAAYDGVGLTQAEAEALQNQLNATLRDRAEAARQRLIEQQRAQGATP